MTCVRHRWRFERPGVYWPATVVQRCKECGAMRVTAGTPTRCGDCFHESCGSDCACRCHRESVPA